MKKNMKIMFSVLTTAILLNGCGAGDDVEIDLSDPFKSEKKQEKQQDNQENKKSSFPAMEKLTPQLLGMVDTGGPIDMDKVPNGNFIYTADGTFGVHIVDISDPYNLVSEAKDIKDVNGDRLSGRSIVLTSDEKIAVTLFDAFIGYGIRIYDIENKNDIYLLNSFEIEGALLPDRVSTMSKDNNKLFIAKGNGNGFGIVDLSQAKEIVTYNPDNTSIYQIILNENETKLYATTSEGFLILDISDINNIKEITKVKNNQTDEIALSADGNRIYSRDYSSLYASGSGFSIYDVSDPKNISKIGFIEVSDPKSFALSKNGDVIYVYTDDNVLKIFDIRDPQIPVLIGSLDIPDLGRSTDMILSDDEQFLYIGDYYDGIYAIKLK